MDVSIRPQAESQQANDKVATSELDELKLWQPGQLTAAQLLRHWDRSFFTLLNSMLVQGDHLLAPLTSCCSVLLQPALWAILMSLICGDFLRTSSVMSGLTSNITHRAVHWWGLTSHLNKQWCWCNQRRHGAAPSARVSAADTSHGEPSLSKHASPVLELVLSGGILMMEEPDAWARHWGYSLPELCWGICGKKRLGIQRRIEHRFFQGSVSKLLMLDFSPVGQGDKG